MHINQKDIEYCPFCGETAQERPAIGIGLAECEACDTHFWVEP